MLCTKIVPDTNWFSLQRRGIETRGGGAGCRGKWKEGGGEQWKKGGGEEWKEGFGEEWKEGGGEEWKKGGFGVEW